MERVNELKAYIKSYGKAAVAFSGGVDSAFLIKASLDALGYDNVIAVTVLSNVIAEEEKAAALKMAREIGIRHITVDFDIFDIEGFKENPPDRCYICKKKIFEEIIRIAGEHGIDTVFDGTNADDEGDYRPGMKALKELGVVSPLKACGITKAEVREYSRGLELWTWNVPSLACLASRVPYNELITEEKLRMVEKAETYIRSYGFSQLRVRCHERIARIELLPEELAGLDLRKMKAINDKLKELGFSYVTLDMGGYRTGSLNDAIKQE